MNSYCLLWHLIQLERGRTTGGWDELEDCLNFKMNTSILKTIIFVSNVEENDRMLPNWLVFLNEIKAGQLHAAFKPTVRTAFFLGCNRCERFRFKAT